MSILSKFVNSFREVFGKLLAFVRDPERRKRAEQVLREASDIAVFAVQAAKAVAAVLTPNSKVDDDVVALVEVVLERAKDRIGAITEEADSDKREGMVRALARDVTRYVIERALGVDGQIKIGGRVISSLDAVKKIADHVINAAVELAYTTLKNGGELPPR